MAPLYLGSTAISKVYKGSTELPQNYIGESGMLSAGPVFSAVEYSGNSTTQTITGVGFEPDMIWIMDKGGSGRQYFFWRTSTSNNWEWINFYTDESIQTSTLITPNSDGWSMGYSFGINYTGYNYVAYCWKINGGSYSSNTDGDITSNVTVSTDVNISVVQYTGNGSASQTVGHGLGATPDSIFFFEYGTADKILEIPAYSQAARTNEEADMTSPYTTAVNSSTFTLDASRATQTGNDSGRNYVAICLKSKSGVSYIGTRTGTTSGVNVGGTLDFEPKLYWTKCVDLNARNGSTYDYDWLLYDDYITNGATSPFQTNDGNRNASRSDVSFNASTVNISTGTGTWASEQGLLNHYGSKHWDMIFGV